MYYSHLRQFSEGTDKWANKQAAFRGKYAAHEQTRAMMHTLYGTALAQLTRAWIPDPDVAWLRTDLERQPSVGSYVHD